MNKIPKLLHLLMLLFLTVTVSAQTRLTVSELTGRQVRPLLGVNAGPVPSGEPGNADLTDEYRAAGVELVRTHDFYGAMDMSTIYPNQNADPQLASSYDFTLSDTTCQAILDGGFELYLRLGDSYNNSRAVTNRANFVKAAVEVVRHYKEMAASRGRAMRYVEVWNEPDGGRFWKGTREEFYTLFADLVVALKSAFPELKVGGPGLTPAGFLSPQGQAYTKSFLDFLKARNIALDFFSWHIYTNNPEEFLTAAKFYRSELDARGYKTTAMHLSEWNTEYREGPNSDPAVRTGAKGAALMTTAWIYQQASDIELSAFYRGNDTSPKLPTFHGLFYADGRPKPVGLAFSLWAQFARYVLERKTTTSLPLVAISAENASGEMAILLANTSSTEHSWQLELPWAIAVVPKIDVFQVSDRSSALENFQIEATTGEIPAWGVQLLVIKRPAQSSLSVSVVSPKQGDSLVSGTQAQVVWNTSGTAIKHELYISTDGGRDFAPLATATGEARTASFTVPKAESGVVRVTATDPSGLTASGLSGFFTIVIPDITAPTVTAVTVDGGAKKVKRGKTVTVAWQSRDDTSVVSHRVELSLDGGSTFPITLASGLSGSSYQWTVSESKTKTAVVRVVAEDAAGNRGAAISSVFKIK